MTLEFFLRSLLKRKRNISSDTSRVSESENFKCEDDNPLKDMSLSFVIKKKIFSDEIIILFCGKNLSFYYYFKLIFLFCFEYAL